MSSKLSTGMTDQLRRIQEAGDKGYRGWIVGRTTDALVRRGLIHYNNDPKDPLSRMVYWHLTAAGKRALS